MKPIPISTAEQIAKSFGYDQVIIVARKVGDPRCSEAVTTYGINKMHCKVAAKIGEYLKHKIMRWPHDD